MAGGEQDTAVRLVLSDDVGSSRGRKNGVLSNDELRHTVGRTYPQDRLDGFWREESTVSTYNQGSTIGLNGIEDGLNEVLCVVLGR